MSVGGGGGRKGERRLGVYEILIERRRKWERERGRDREG